MNRSEYIAQLTAALRGKLAFDEIEDIVRDYQEFFDEGVRQGKSEEQVAAELGNPRDVAQQILSEERETPSSGTASSEGGFRDSFTRGAEKVADSADQFAKKANAFTRRKMEEHEQRKARRQEERASRAVWEDSSRYSRRSGCLGALLKLAAAVIAAPFALAFLICCLVGVILGVAGIVAAICGFVVLGMVLAADSVHSHCLRRGRTHLCDLLLHHSGDCGVLAAQGGAGIYPGSALRTAHR